MDHGVAELLERRTAPISDRGVVMNVVSWLLLLVVIAMLIARFAMKLSIKNKQNRFGLDDLFIAAAALFSLGQTVAVSVESIHALGQHLDQLQQSQITIFQKAEYVSCMLYIANMGCARISLCILIKKILPGNVPHCTVMVFAVFTALWTITGVLVTAFPCKPPEPWKFEDPDKCYDLVKWVNYVGVTNIVVEVLLVMIPLFVWNIRLSAGRRASVSCVFVARLSIVGAVGAQLHFFNRDASFFDYTYKYWTTALCIQVAQNLSVITACLPYLHPFIIRILGDSSKTTTLQIFKCEGKNLRDYFRRKNFDPTWSHSSRTPINEKEDSEYCRPLKTHGLDRSSAHLHSQHFNRFPCNVATPIKGPEKPPDVFMRSVDYPRSRPGTAHSHSKELPPIPKALSDVGVIPAPDWETDSSGRSSQGRDSPSTRRPPSEYVFNRQKVISVPEEDPLYNDGQYYKKYYPPLPSPGMPRRPRKMF